MPLFLAPLFDNPILVRELRRRMRGKALMYGINTYIVLMAATTALILMRAPMPWAEASLEMLQSLKRTGELIFIWITFLQAGLVLIVAPTITAGLTTGERERKTFEFLQVTTISQWMYILGCFLSTAFYVGLALMCALPLLSLSFVYGGVTLNDVVSTFFVLLGNSFVLSAFGLYISSICQRTRTSQGVIVFLVFGLFFMGLFLQQAILSAYEGATAGAAATGAQTGSREVYFFAMRLPFWLLGFALQLALTGVFLLLAARKLFNPADTREFAHWQFIVLFLGVLAIFAGYLSGNVMPNELGEIVFVFAGYVMLLVAVLVFAVGRMELGDEIWHLKRLFPVLRPFDQTVPFLFLIGFIWYLAIDIVPSGMVRRFLSDEVMATLKWSTLSSYALLCVLGRAMTVWQKGSRPDAARWTLIAGAAILVVIPVTGNAILVLLPGAERVGRELLAFSPPAVLMDTVQSPAGYQAGAFAVGSVAASVYIGAAVLLGIYAEWLRFRRWRHFDYHYEMPLG